MSCALVTRWLCIPSFLALCAIAHAQPRALQEDAGAKEVAHEQAAPVERDFKGLQVGQETLAYSTRTGRLTLEAEDGKERAHLFFVAYERRLKANEKRAEIPLTFVFNGGPGSSSVWLHLGLLGPQRVRMDEKGFPLPPPYELVPNEHTLLDQTDLVFIDPVSTGYSRAADGEEPSQFHGLREDIESVADFIRLYVTRYERWSSPKYLCGESYGSTRAAGLADHLQRVHGMYLNGVVLISSILDFQTARFDVGNDLPYALFLPTYTATAWYHRRLSQELSGDLREVLDEVEAFALGDYSSALLRGNRLSSEEREEIATRLARYTGLSKEYVLSANLRINIGRFTKELRRDERTTVGRLDSRFTGLDRDASGQSYDFDPSMSAISGPYTACLNDYVRRELGYTSDLPYEILTGRVHPWSYGSNENSYVNVAEDLRSAMAHNRDLQVFVANGYFDLATPYFATQYTFDHLAMDPGYAERVSMTWYEAGHMMYIHLPSLARLKRDLASFYTQSH